MQSAKVAILVGGLGLAACISAWLFLRSSPLEPGAFKRPFHVARARATPDGGTLEIRLVDAEGRPLLAWRVGSLAVEPSRQELHVVTYRWSVPAEVNAPKGSSMEALVREALRVWLGDKVSAEQKAMLESSHRDVLRSMPFDVIASYDLASWIDRRQ